MFKANIYHDPKTALKEFKHTTPIFEYQAQIDDLSNKVTAFFIASYINYLKRELFLGRSESYV